MRFLGLTVAALAALLVVLAAASTVPRLFAPGFGAAARAIANPSRAALAAKHCDIHRDESGVVHARGGDELVAYACFGFVHGRERAWQVDYLRRAAQGRLAETLGMPQVKNDFFMRLLGIAERAEKIFKEMGPRDQELLWAYTEGMNRGISAALEAGVYELKALGYTPEPWRPEHSVAILLLQSFFETQKTLWQDLKEEKLREKLGPKAEALYRRDGLPWDTAILKPGEFAPRSEAQRLPRREPGRNTREGELPFAEPPGETGSNSWALAPKLTASKRAWLANDPHLELLHPPFWLWAHVAGGELDVIGASLPGTPVIASGMNRHTAWGLTDSYIDVGEIVSLPSTDDAGYVSQRPTIWIKAGFLQVPYVFKSFSRTRDGWPVLPLDAPAGRTLVLRWTGLLVKGSGLSGFHRLMESKSAADVDAFFAGLELPSWNFVFADTGGRIGYRAVGVLPKQEIEPVFGVRDGRAKELESWPLLTPDEKPRLFDPARGFVATANNRQLPPGARLHMGRAHPQGFRAFRIEELLTKRSAHDLESQQAIQCDTQAVGARFLVPKLLSVVAKSDTKGAGWGPREARAVATLGQWDFSTGPDCVACAIHERWLDRILDATSFDISALYRALDEPAAILASVAEALPKALNDLKVTSDGAFPRWSEVHRATFPHLSRDARFQSADSIATPGSPFSVNVAQHAWEDGRYRHTSGASQRLLVELTSPPTAWMVLAGPNRDTPARALEAPDSPWTRWRDCRYEKVRFPLEWEKVALERIDL